MPEVSVAALAIRLAISMGIVLVLMVVAAKLLRRAQSWASSSASGSARGRGARPAKVTRTPIDVGQVAPIIRGASVAVVRTCGRELVLGVTEHSVTLLHSAIETIDDRDGAGDGARAVTAIDLDGDSLPSAPHGTARIAAPAPQATDVADGLPARTDILELLRARTVRR